MLNIFARGSAVAAIAAAVLGSAFIVAQERPHLGVTYEDILQGYNGTVPSNRSRRTTSTGWLHSGRFRRESFHAGDLKGRRSSRTEFCM